MSDDDASGSGSGWLKFGVTTVLAIGAVAVGLVQFGTTNFFSVRQPFLEMQSELCRSAAEHVARLASTIDLPTWQKSREEFWMLYWGPLAIVEDVESPTKVVAPAMIAFGERLKQVDPKSPTLPVTSLEGPAIDVAHACQALLSSKWNVGILKLFAPR